MNNKIIEALLFVGTFAFGLIVSPALKFMTEPMISTVNRILLASMLLMAFALLIGAYAAVRLGHRQQQQFSSISSDVSVILRRLGLTVEFFTEKSKQNETDPYAMPTRLIAGAQKEILVLDHRPDISGTRFYARSPFEAAARKRYYDALNRKARSTTSDGTYFRYSRIVQLEDGPTSKWRQGSPADDLFVEHCRAVIDFRHTYSKAACAVRTSRVFFPNSSIVIVDGTHVLMELAITGPDGRSKVEGDLLFIDRDGVLAGPLGQLISNIESQSILITEVE